MRAAGRTTGRVYAEAGIKTGLSGRERRGAAVDRPGLSESACYLKILKSVMRKCLCFSMEKNTGILLSEFFHNDILKINLALNSMNSIFSERIGGI